jgi:hypothetical protein
MTGLASIVIGLSLGGPVSAETVDLSAMNIEGRWAAEDGRLTLDMSRCKEGWCGVEVTVGGCGKTALRIAAPDPAERLHASVQFLGRLELAAQTQPYAVHATFVQRESKMQMQLVGHTGEKFELWRRTFPLRMLLARSGEAQCRPESKTS